MLIIKLMRDGSMLLINVDDKQAEFLLKYDSKKYSIAENINDSKNEIPDLIIEDVKEEIKTYKRK